MRRITYFFALFATLFTAVGTQTASAQFETMETGKWFRIKSAAKNTVLTACDENGNMVTGQDVTDGSDLCHGEQYDNDGQLFRFVEYGIDKNYGTVYAVQNKATGLYISTECKLTKVPGECVTEKYYGVENAMIIYFATLGEDFFANMAGCLGKPSTGKLEISWDTKEDQVYFIEEVADVAEDYQPAPLVVSDEPGKISLQCWPVELSCQNGMYKVVIGSVVLPEVNFFLALKKITTANAGEPFFYIHGVGQEWNTDMVDAEFQIGNGVSMEPKTANGMIGTFTDRSIDYSNGGFIDASGQLSFRKAAEIPAYSAYVSSDTEFMATKFTEDYDIMVQLDTANPIPTAIDKTLQKVGKAGNVYDMSGRQVATGATLDDVQRLPAGTYIFNGVKVGVK